MLYPALSKQIIRLKKEDLKLRDLLIQQKKLNDGYHPEMEKMHVRNATILEDIIDSIGYPTIKKVGEEASEAAWLVIQHSISNPVFMRKALKLLEKAVLKNEASAINLAYLSDRIAVFENKPQLYGTQFDWDKNGILNPNKLDDFKKVNQRRKNMGLNSLEEQITLIRKRTKDENQSAPKDLQQRQKEFETWKQKVGWISKKN